MVDDGPGQAGEGVRRIPRVAHPAAPVVVLTVSGVLVMIGTFMPWVGSGDSSRSSYRLLGVLDRLEVTPDGVIATLVRWWPMVPLLVTAAIVLAWWGAHRSAATLAPVAALYAGGVAVAIRWVAGDTGIDAGFGVVLCAAASVALLLSGAWMWVRIATGRDVRAPHEARPVDRS